MNKKRILVIEDEQQLVKAIKIRLEYSGYEVLIAGNGQEGLDQVCRQNPDLILLDAMMPKMDGYQVCGSLKADSRYNKIPIIMLTAKAQEEDKRLGEKVGADAYIAKPFDHKVLIETISKLLLK